MMARWFTFGDTFVRVTHRPIHSINKITETLTWNIQTFIRTPSTYTCPPKPVAFTMAMWATFGDICCRDTFSIAFNWLIFEQKYPIVLIHACKMVFYIINSTEKIVGWILKSIYWILISVHDCIPKLKTLQSSNAWGKIQALGLSLNIQGFEMICLKPVGKLVYFLTTLLPRYRVTLTLNQRP